MGKYTSINVKGLKELFFFRKKLKVNLGEMENEGESMSSFLSAALNVKVTSDNDSLLVDSEKLSAEELKKQVTKFIYRRHLNQKYWVAVEGGSVKIHMFEAKKREKKKKQRGTPPSTIKHGW
jgi:hypothetical protein